MMTCKYMVKCILRNSFKHSWFWIDNKFILNSIRSSWMQLQVKSADPLHHCRRRRGRRRRRRLRLRDFYCWLWKLIVVVVASSLPSVISQSLSPRKRTGKRQTLSTNWHFFPGSLKRTWRPWRHFGVYKSYCHWSSRQFVEMTPPKKIGTRKPKQTQARLRLLCLRSSFQGWQIYIFDTFTIVACFNTTCMDPQRQGGTRFFVFV